MQQSLTRPLPGTAPTASRHDAWNLAPRWPVAVFSRLYKLVELLTLALGSAMGLAMGAWVLGALRPGNAALVLAAMALGSFEMLRLCRCYTWERLAGEEGFWRAPLVAAVMSALIAGTCFKLLGMPGWQAAQWMTAPLVVNGVLIGLLRGFTAERVQVWLRRGMFASRVAIVGNAAGAAFAQRLSADDAGRVMVLGRYSETRLHFDQPGDAAGNRRGDLDGLLLDCKLGRVDAVVLAVSPDERDRLRELTELLRPSAQDIYTVAECVDIAGPDARPTVLGQQSVLLLRARPVSGLQALSKAVFDWVAALVIFLVIAPLLVFVAVLIRLESPGPVLFRQLRVGYNNRLFWILKFRSMRNDSADALATQQTVRNDPRVTRVGAVIRKLSIDELPQLLNVLRGDMSLVGPRPHAPGTSADGKRVHELVDGYPCRHLVKPGITGLAQVRGFRGGMHTTQQVTDRLQADLEYSRRQSLWLDIKIIIMTVMREARSKRAF